MIAVWSNHLPLFLIFVICFALFTHFEAWQFSRHHWRQQLILGLICLSIFEMFYIQACCIYMRYIWSSFNINNFYKFYQKIYNLDKFWQSQLVNLCEQWRTSSHDNHNDLAIRVTLDSICNIKILITSSIGLQRGCNWFPFSEIIFQFSCLNSCF